MVRLETARLTLRPFEMGDLEDLHGIFGDPEVMTFVEPAYSRDKCGDFLRDFCVERTPPGALAAARKADGRVVGYVLFKELKEPGVYELGWIFARSVWRQGMAFEAMSALLSHAFEHMGVRRLCAEAVDTTKSVPLMVKLGMQHESTRQLQEVLHSDGQQYDLHWYSLSREDWLAGHSETCPLGGVFKPSKGPNGGYFSALLR